MMEGIDNKFNTAGTFDEVGSSEKMEEAIEKEIIITLNELKSEVDPEKKKELIKKLRELIGKLEENEL